MPDALRTIKNKIKNIYGDDWFDNSYIIDWQVSDPFKKMMSLTNSQDCRVGIVYYRPFCSGSSSLREGLLPK